MSNIEEPQPTPEPYVDFGPYMDQVSRNVFRQITLPELVAWGEHEEGMPVDMAGLAQKIKSQKRRGVR